MLLVEPCQARRSACEASEAGRRLWPLCPHFAALADAIRRSLLTGQALEKPPGWHFLTLRLWVFLIRARG